MFRNRRAWGTLRPPVAAAAYEGAGDVMPGAYGWWGLRAYNAAYAVPGTGKAVTLDNGGGSVVDIVILPDGTLDAATAAPLIATHKVTKVWDQTGAGKHMTVTFAEGATLSLTSPYRIRIPPGVNCLTGTVITLAQPYTISGIISRVSATSHNAAILVPMSVGGGVMVSYPNIISLNFGAGFPSSFSYTLNTLATVQALVNGASSKLYVEGVLDTGNAGTLAFASDPYGVGNFTPSDPSEFIETGLWAGDKSADFAALDINQHDFWWP